MGLGVPYENATAGHANVCFYHSAYLLPLGAVEQECFKQFKGCIWLREMENSTWEHCQLDFCLSKSLRKCHAGVALKQVNTLFQISLTSMVAAGEQDMELQ